MEPAQRFLRQLVLKDEILEVLVPVNAGTPKDPQMTVNLQANARVQEVSFAIHYCIGNIADLGVR